MTKPTKLPCCHVVPRFIKKTKGPAMGAMAQERSLGLWVNRRRELSTFEPKT